MLFLWVLNRYFKLCYACIGIKWKLLLNVCHKWNDISLILHIKYKTIINLSNNWILQSSQICIAISILISIENKYICNFDNFPQDSFQFGLTVLFSLCKQQWVPFTTKKLFLSRLSSDMSPAAISGFHRDRLNLCSVKED